VEKQDGGFYRKGSGLCKIFAKEKQAAPAGFYPQAQKASRSGRRIMLPAGEICSSWLR